MQEALRLSVCAARVCFRAVEVPLSDSYYSLCRPSKGAVLWVGWNTFIAEEPPMEAASVDEDDLAWSFVGFLKNLPRRKWTCCGHLPGPQNSRDLVTRMREEVGWRLHGEHGHRRAILYFEEYVAC